MTTYQVAYVVFTLTNGVRTDSGMLFTVTETANTEEIENMLRIQHGHFVEVLAVRPAPTV